jgi:hypothetical protein
MVCYRRFLHEGCAPAETTALMQNSALGIANRAVTWQVVHGHERRGIAVFGPI